MHLVLDGRTLHDHFPGVGRYTYNLARSLAEGQPGLTLTLLYDPSRPNTRFALEALQCPPAVRLVHGAAPAMTAAEQWRLPRQLHELGAAVYHSPYYVMPYLPGVPTVLTLYDLIPLRYPQDYAPIARLAFALTTRLAVWAAARVITISQCSAEDVRRKLRVPAQRVTVIPPAADPMFAPQAAPVVEAVRKRLGLPPDYLLYFGSNKPHKNLPRLIAAYLRMGPLANQLPLVVAGHWDPRYPEARAAAERAGATGRIRFAGPVAPDDLPALYSGARLFVFPSLFEGFGLPVLEAMACGAPVLCADTPALREVGAEAAVYFDPRDAGAIGMAIERGLREPGLREALRERGLARAREFSWDKAARATLDVYARVLAERTSPE